MAAITAESSPVIKFLVVGDAGVGKTSVIQRYVNDTFSATLQPTVGVDFFIKEVALEGAGEQTGGTPTRTVRVQLWDIAGQDRTKKVNRVYFKEALGAFIVYDVSRPRTFDSAVKWKQELDGNVTLPNGNPLPVVLLGNKVDLEVAKVDVAYVDRLVKKHGFIAWSDVSAKDTTNTDFELSVECLVQRLVCGEELFGPSTRRSATAFARRLEAHNERAHSSIKLGSGGGVRVVCDKTCGDTADTGGGCCG